MRRMSKLRYNGFTFHSYPGNYFSQIIIHNNFRIIRILFSNIVVDKRNNSCNGKKQKTKNKKRKKTEPTVGTRCFNGCTFFK